MECFCTECCEHSSLVNDNRLACGHFISDTEIELSERADQAVTNAFNRRDELLAEGYSKEEAADIMFEENLRAIEKTVTENK
jgi:hypothetical protein